MGLDMFLYKRTYVKNWNHTPMASVTTIKLTGDRTKSIKPERVTYIEEEMGYWRKFNALHSYIVKNYAEGEDNYQPVYLSYDDIIQINNVLKKISACPEEATELMPTSEGFFFGSTDYGEYYQQDIEDSIRIFDQLIAEYDGNCDYYYKASW